jgi:hypothetical protein
MRGQVWINKNGYTLIKILCSFDRQEISSTELSVEYTLLDNTIYPKRISSKLVNNKFSTRESQKKIYIENDIQFSKIDPVIRKDAKDFYNGYFIEYNLPSFAYDKDYWRLQTIQNNPFKNKLLEILGGKDIDTEFEQGASKKIFRDDSKCSDALSSFKKSSEKTIDYMKKNVTLNKNLDTSF